MAPEQAAGERRLDGRCDLFSTGVVLFEMLTGGLPFPGRDRRKVARRIVNQPVPDPRELNPDVPLAMVDILSAALKKNPEERYATALVFTTREHANPAACSGARRPGLAPPPGIVHLLKSPPK